MTVEARMEAAAKLSNNYQAASADVLKNPGIQGEHQNELSGT